MGVAGRPHDVAFRDTRPFRGQRNAGITNAAFKRDNVQQRINKRCVTGFERHCLDGQRIIHAD